MLTASFCSSLKRSKVNFRALASPAINDLREIFASFLRMGKDMYLGNGKKKFALGVGLVVWPVIVAMLLPSAYLSNLNKNLLSSGRLPVAIFCVVALISEAVAVSLLFPSRRLIVGKSEDRMNSWLVVATAVAGVCTLAFFIAAVANVVQVW